KPPGYTGGPWASGSKQLMGWHKQFNRHVASFMDGSARYLIMDTRYVYGQGWSIWANKPWKGGWSQYNDFVPEPPQPPRPPIGCVVLGWMAGVVTGSAGHLVCSFDENGRYENLGLNPRLLRMTVSWPACRPSCQASAPGKAARDGAKPA